MSGLKIAVPTMGNKLLNDRVADTFSRASTFTFVSVQNGKIMEVYFIKNDAKELKQGAGPLVAGIMKENGVEFVLSGDIGPGASSILNTIDIKIVKIKSGLKVRNVIYDWLKEKASVPFIK